MATHQLFATKRRVWTASGPIGYTEQGAAPLPCSCTGCCSMGIYGGISWHIVPDAAVYRGGPARARRHGNYWQRGFIGNRQCQHARSVSMHLTSTRWTGRQRQRRWHRANFRRVASRTCAQSDTDQLRYARQLAPGGFQTVPDDGSQRWTACDARSDAGGQEHLSIAAGAWARHTNIRSE